MKVLSTSIEDITSYKHVYTKPLKSGSARFYCKYCNLGGMESSKRKFGKFRVYETEDGDVFIKCLKCNTETAIRFG